MKILCDGLKHTTSLRKQIWLFLEFRRWKQVLHQRAGKKNRLKTMTETASNSVKSTNSISRRSWMMGLVIG